MPEQLRFHIISPAEGYTLTSQQCFKKKKKHLVTSLKLLTYQT